MDTEKEHKLDCGGFEITYTGQQIELDGYECVKGTEVKLDDNHFLRMSIITSGPDGELANQVEFRLVTIEKQGQDEHEQDSELVDWFWGYGDDRPFDIDAVLKEYWNMVKIHLQNYKPQMKVFHLYDGSTYIASIKAYNEQEANDKLSNLGFDFAIKYTKLFDVTNLQTLMNEYKDIAQKTVNMCNVKYDITNDNIPTITELFDMIKHLQSVLISATKLKMHLEQEMSFLSKSGGKILE